MSIRDNHNSSDPQLLPDFCDNRVVLLVILIAELLAIVLTLAQTHHSQDWLTNLGYYSLFIQGTALLDASLLCYFKKYFSSLKPQQQAILIYCFLQLMTLLITLLSFSVLQYSHMINTNGSHWKIYTLIQNLGISAIISAATMRYFYVRLQWGRQLKAENIARIEALQARIRPHFLFNSMNTIASLVHDDPSKAETAILDLADLFRSTLADLNNITLSEELDITRRYLRIEALRLGDRLKTDWQLSDNTNSINVPALIIQPLVENAIYHGIEPLAEGGTVTIGAYTKDSSLIIYINNPFNPHNKRKPGNQIALENIRQRLKLAHEGRANLNITLDNSEHKVTITLPIRNEEENKP